MTAKFYGIGLGPGDPGLVTLRALEVLQSAGRIFCVAARGASRSVSASILAALPGGTAEVTELEFTMSTDWEERLARIDGHAAAILELLRGGVECAFASIGDPMTYSTCSYLLRALRKLEPELAYEIVPGVNSWSALAAKCGEVLCEDEETLRIVPGYSVADGEDPAAFSGHGTTVLLKAYRNRNRLLKTLPPGAQVLYGANIGLAGEVCCSDVGEMESLPEAYLSMLVVKH
ncbi:precorrin-2 C(20)-methyltransferase [uncultured Victivallis sp.]|uniref:precorrin-2 C(20)-methyltransferase n=1 Tax=uncultured Victivallis sp. TaxID=354118 RepID=UPI0025D06571|nr:precorrin-2 C(20)-methyltransferase [uncultured Victivallis sp.]